MTTRQELLTHWQEQLLIAEESDREVASWRARIRRRLYRFLLAMYGGAGWSGSPQDADEVVKHPVALLVSDGVDLPESPADATWLDHGKAPRTRAEILAGLKHVRGLSDELAPPGPLQNGLPADAPVAVAASKKRRRAESLMSHLKAAGFAPTLVRRAELFQVFVMAGDAAAAAALLARQAPPRKPTPQSAGTSSSPVIRTSPLLVWSFICGVIGIVLTFYVYYLLHQYAVSPRVDRLPTPDRFAVLMAVTGILDVLAGIFLWLSWREAHGPH